MAEKKKDIEQDDIVEDDSKEKLETGDAPQKSSVFSNAKRKVASMSRKKRDIDPIIAVSAVVLILACAIVLGNATYDTHFNKNPGPAVEYGSTVAVDYTGSYNGYYDQSPNARVFDTTLKSVDTDSKFVKSWEYKSTSFKNVNVTVGKGTYLAMFENALIGHHVGDTVTVHIPAADAYGKIPTSQILKYEGKGYVSISTILTAENYKDLFGKAAPTDGTIMLPECLSTADKDKTPSTPYGFASMVTKRADGTVMVSYECAVGQTYRMNKEMNVTVTEIKDGKIYFDYKIVNPDYKGMIRICQDNTPMYLCINANEKYIKTCDEKTGEDLYFTIKICGFVKEKT